MSTLSEAIGRIAHAFDASDSRRAYIRALALRVFDLDEQNARLEEARYLVDARIAAAVAAEREAWKRITGADSPDALDFTLGRLSLDQWIDHTRAALTAMEREACAKVADDFPDRTQIPGFIAAAIRARGGKS